jgi:hypothetical protein
MSIEKPEGYDLREKRAYKNQDARDWTPADALYGAHERTKDQEVTQLIVYWWEKQPDGSEVLKYSSSTQSTAEHAYILQKALSVLLK